MLWFKHHNNLLRRKETQRLLDKNGTKGVYALMRLLEILAENFEPDSPEFFLESKRDLFSNLFPTCSNKTGERILNALQDTGWFRFKIRGKEILIGSKFISELSDNYTKKALRGKKNLNQ